MLQAAKAPSSQANTLRCRACGSRDVRISYPRIWDYLLSRFRHFEVFRCRACQHRFRTYLQ